MKKYLVLFLLTFFTVAVFGTGTQEGAGAVYPTKTIQLIVPTRAGGATDTGARILAEYLQKELGQTIVVVNQDGGGGLIGMETVRNADPDGYTLLYHHTQLHAGYHTGKYDISFKDYRPVATAISVNETITVHAESPWYTLEDFVEDAKQHPGEYTFGVQLGSISHFMAGALMAETGIELNVVSAGGEVDKLAAMQGGILHAIMASVGSGKQYQEAGTMRVLAVAAEQRDVTAPDLPTAVEQGYNVLMPAMHTVYAPAGTPDDVVEVISAAMARLVENKDFNDALNTAGQVYEYRPVAETEGFIEAEDGRIDSLAVLLGMK